MLTLTSYLHVLLRKLGVPFSENMGDDGIFSLKVDNFTYHFKVHSEKYLVIYSLVDASDTIVKECMSNILDMNHFSDEEHSPVFAYDNSARQFLIWNRQKAYDINDGSVLPQLEAIMAANEAIATLITHGKKELDAVVLGIKPQHMGIRC
ncbi:CesT family type III secretion system chaperone [Yersinia aldovae]|uniref:CesT family type III secretion system chaperone n=1 Tax=Yersinia aldovae TaxID=29483 RepID=UPI00119D92E1|nr:CesT family type III secretion system chaperone [Yersinia aldovae]